MSKKPIHPGFILAETVKESGMTLRDFAGHVGVNASTLQRLMSGQAALTPVMALKLEKVLGKPAMYWLETQIACDLEKARKVVDVSGLRRLTLRKTRGE